jgi:hypothetical protein
MYEGGNGRLNVVWCSPGSVTLLFVVAVFVLLEAIVVVVVLVFPLLEKLPAEVLVLFEFNLPTEVAGVVELAPPLLWLVSVVDDDMAEVKDLVDSSMDDSRNDPRILGRR